VSPEGEAGGSHLREVRDVDFPAALRGYDREAVDAYVERVSRLVAELEASRSPEAAVRRALDQVGEETTSILQQAQETASEVTARSRAQADDRLREAEHEAAAITADAEERVRELDADFARVWDQRDRLLDEVRQLAERLLAVADDAEDRWAPQAEEADEHRGDTAAIPAVAADDLTGPPWAAPAEPEPGPAGSDASGDSPDFAEVYDHEADLIAPSQSAERAAGSISADGSLRGPADAADPGSRAGVADAPDADRYPAATAASQADPPAGGADASGAGAHVDPPARPGADEDSGREPGAAEPPAPPEPPRSS